MDFPAACYLGVCLSVAAATTAGFEISERGFAIGGGVHIGVVLAADVFRTSLVRSAT